MANPIMVPLKRRDRSARELAFDFSMVMLDMLDNYKASSRPMIHATLDDVGTCQQDGMSAVVGYVAYKEQWERFNWRWMISLEQLKLDHLHTAKYLNNFPLIGGDGITDEDVYTILSPFINIVREELLLKGGFGVCVITECAAYTQLTLAEKKYIREPEMHSFEMAVGLSCFEIKNELMPQNHLAVQMDESHNAPKLYERYQALKAENDTICEHLACIAFCDDKKHYPVQAADMLGNITLKAWRSRQTGQDWPKAFKELVFVDGQSTVAYRLYDLENLKKVAGMRMNKQERMAMPDQPPNKASQ